MMYVVKIYNLNTGTSKETVMRSPSTETKQELYTRAVAKLYGRGAWFYREFSQGYENIGRVARASRHGGTDLFESVRVDTFAAQKLKKEESKGGLE